MPAKRLYKPALLMSLLGLSQAKFRYWRQELDPMPTRSLFTYQHLLAYAVLRELIVDRWVGPSMLKRLDMKAFFDWFDMPHSADEFANTVVFVDKANHEIYFLSPDTDRPKLDRFHTELILLQDVENFVLQQFRNCA